MVLEFGILKTQLFGASEATGEGINTNRETVIVRQLVDGAFAGPYFITKIDTSLTAGGQGILAHSRLIWTLINGINSRRTTDGGYTWSDVTGDNGHMEISAMCRANKALAIACSDASNICFYTTDSGANWTGATEPTGWTGVTCLDFPTATLAVAGLDRGTAAVGIMRSTDGGVNWSIATTGPVADVVAIGMLDGTTGYAVDDVKNIWKTTDGGVNWTDTTHDVDNVSAAEAYNHSLTVVSSTTFIFARHVTELGLYDNSAGTFTRKMNLYNTPNVSGCQGTNIIKTANGNYYYAQLFTVVDGSTRTASHIYLYKSMDKGVTWGMAVIPAPVHSNLGVFKGSDTTLGEFAPNRLVMTLGSGTVLEIDLTGDTNPNVLE